MESYNTDLEFMEAFDTLKRRLVTLELMTQQVENQALVIRNAIKESERILAYLETT